MIEREDFKPHNNETLEQYKYRLFAQKESNKSMTWADVQYLLNHYFNSHVSTDFIRHEAYSARKVKEIEDINVGTRILCVSDTHVPFNLPVETFVEYRGKVDVLVLSGDLLDCQGISKFSKNFRVPLMEEMIKGREFMIELIDCIAPKKVVINYGNHELRYLAYLAKKLDADMLGFMPNTALDLICDLGFYHYDHRLRTRVFYEPLSKVYENTDINIEYTQNWWCKVGKTIFAHPSAYCSPILGTTQKAMNFFLQERVDFDCMVLAHTHKVAFSKVGEIYLYEQGCCCDSSEMSYTDGKLYSKQQNGCIYVVQDKDGDLIYDKTKLVLL